MRRSSRSTSLSAPKCLPGALYTNKYTVIDIVVIKSIPQYIGDQILSVSAEDITKKLNQMQLQIIISIKISRLVEVCTYAVVVGGGPPGPPGGGGGFD